MFEGASQRHGDIVFGKVDTEAQQELAATFGIMSIPTLMISRDKVVLYAQPGALPQPALEDLIAKVRAVGHDLANLAEGVGGPRDPAVLYTAETIVAELDGLTVRRAGRVRRPVDTEVRTSEAVDTLVRAIRD